MCDVFYRRILPADGVSRSRYHLNYLPNDIKPSCPPGVQPHRSKNLHGTQTHVGAARPRGGAGRAAPIQLNGQPHHYQPFINPTEYDSR